MAGDPTPDEQDSGPENGEQFKKGGKLDISQGPVKERKCTDIIFLIIFIASFIFFWICALQGASDGDPWKLVKPRDYKGQYCDIADQWNGGTDMSNFENMLYTLNLEETMESVAYSFLCTDEVKNVLTNSGTAGANVVNTTAFDTACPTSDSATWSSLSSSITTQVSKYTTTAGVTELLTGSGGVSSILDSVTKYFTEVCVTSCGLTSSNAGSANGGRDYLFMPAGDRSWVSVWSSLLAYSNANPSSTVGALTLSLFQLGALSQDVCPYDANKCVPLPVIKFSELSSTGYCLIEVDSGLLNVASSVSSTVASYLDGLAETSIADSMQTGLDSAVGDIELSWDTFIIVAVLCFVIGIIFLVLLRFFVKPVVWVSIILIFVLLVVGGIVAMVYSSLCADSSFTDAATDVSSVVTGASGVAQETCGGYYEVEDSTARDVLWYSAWVIWVLAICWALTVVCLFGRIRLAIALNEVAAMFVYQTPHIVLVPIVQGLVAIGWCALWMFLAAFLLSQVPTDYVPTSCFTSYSEAYGTDGDGGKCTDVWPTGYVWKDDSSTDCINSGCCWKCSPPRYMMDYRFWFSLFSFFWINAIAVAIGQCTIAGAVGIWFFNNKDWSAKLASLLSVFQSLKNCLRYHLGSMAFGSFILAVVQTVKWFMHWLEKQAKVQHNRVMEIILKVLGCCLWCLEKCVKFLNKNAYIQVALMGTNFCTSAKNAFFLILRNAIRFGLLGSLGSVIHMIGKLLIVTSTGILGFLILQAMHPEVENQWFIVLLFCTMGYFVGALFMNVFGLAVDTCLQCFIATEEMGIPKEFIPTKLRKLVDDTASEAQTEEKEAKTRCFGCCNGCCS